MLRGVSPYIRDAINWITKIVEINGGSATYYSGRRSLREQQELWDFCEKRKPSVTRFPRVPCPFPVATPGCSQHEYGFAVDAGFFSPANRLGLTSSWNDLAQDLGRQYWGLSTVANDPNHFQMYPITTFLPWARETGQCPPPGPILSFTSTSFPHPDGRVVPFNGGRKWEWY